MSRLFIVAPPETVSGFHLAGIDAYAAEDGSAAQAQIEKWLTGGEQGLLAIDESLYIDLEPIFERRLIANHMLPVIVMPSGRPVGSEITSRHHIAELIREAIGFHITFQDK